MPRPQKDSEDRERLLNDWLTDPETFSAAVFKGFMNPRSLKFLPNGSLQFELAIPPGQVNADTLTIRHLTRDRLPLLISLEVDPNYSSLVDDQRGNLALLPDPEDDD